MTMKRVLREDDIAVQQEGAAVGTRETINIVNPSGEVTVADNAGQDRIDITILDLDKIPANKPLLNADIDAAAAIAKSKVSTSGTWATADIPNLDASKITSGVLAAARGGLGENLNEAAKADDTVIVYKSVADEFQFEAKGAPGAHKDTHDPVDGSDPLDSAAPVNIGTANALGTSHSFNRADHVHGHPSGLGANLHHDEAHTVASTGPHAESGLTIGHVLRASGTSAFSFAAIQDADLPATIARDSELHNEDHAARHGPATGADPLATAVPVNVTKATAAVGTSDSLARADHKHDITTAVVSNIGTANSEGTASSLARSNHVHAHPNINQDIHQVYLLASGARALTGELRLEDGVTVDPSLGASDHGFVWFRSDLGVIKYSRDDGASGTEIVTLNADAEANFFDTGLMLTLGVESFVEAGVGTLTKEGVIAELETGGASGNQVAAVAAWMDSAGDMSGEAGYPIYDQMPQFEVLIRLATTTSQDIWVVWGGSSNVPDTTGEKKFGFHIVNDQIRTFASTGAAQGESANQQQLSANTWYRVRLKRNAATVKMWIDGVAKTDYSTNVPAGAADDQAVIQAVVKANAAAVKKIFFRPVKLMANA